MDDGGAVGVVRAFYETVAAGDDPSVHVTGPLAEAVRIEVGSARSTAIAARSFVARRIAIVREHGDEALVKVDGEHRLAYQHDGEWKPHVSRVRGLARARRTDGGWRVTDVPSGKLSALRSVGVVGPLDRDGDLEFDLAVYEGPKRSTFHLILQNHGTRALTVSRVELETRLLRRFPFVLPIPLSSSIVIEPGASVGFRFGDQHPYRVYRGTVCLLARAETGRCHGARRPFAAASRPQLPALRGRIVSQSRLLEAAAIVFAFTQLAPWWLWSLLVGGLLLLAAITRLPPLLFMLRHGGRSVGLKLAVTVAAAEFIAGTSLLLYDDQSWTTVAVWMSLVGIAYPVVRQIFTTRSQE